MENAKFEIFELKKKGDDSLMIYKNFMNVTFPLNIYSLILAIYFKFYIFHYFLYIYYFTPSLIRNPIESLSVRNGSNCYALFL